MKSCIPLFAVLLLAGALLLRPHSHKIPRVVHADTGCDATSLNGGYGFNLTGFFFDNFGNTNFFSDSGRLVGDGQGGLTGKQTASVNGGVARADAITGSYTMNSDCTGSMTTNSASVGSLTLDFVLTNNGNEIQLIEADRGSDIAGSGKKQIIPVPVSGT